jgi:hypothetical protein
MTKTIVPKLISISSARATDAGKPLTLDDALLLVDVVIGPETEVGEAQKGDLFSFYVTTIEHVSATIEQSGSFICPFSIIVPEYSWESIETSINSILSATELQTCHSWIELARKISVYGDWEFKDAT